VDTLRTKTRDVEGKRDPGSHRGGSGRNLIAVIGIDHYQCWPALSNAVNDARGAFALFERLGFVQAAPMLIDDAATGRAIESLVKDDLVEIGPDDSLVLFYAGHGGNRKHLVSGREVTTGYLIPVDAEEGRVATWVDLDSWLGYVARLPAKHILVILDACHSGIALDRVIKWRDGTPSSEPLSTLRARTSRRIITSARSDERAMDVGPYPGHSLFTGCLIEGLTHGLGRSDDRMATSSELGTYLQRRVGTYPRSQQTPDFGTLEFDERGEMVFSLARDHLEPHREPPAAALSTPTWNDPDDIDEDLDPGLDDDLDGGVELATSSAGSSVIDRDDRSMFWASVEQHLDPPTTTRGARTEGPQNYRHGAFAGNVRLGVVANTNGAMRVHLWSTHRKHQQTLQTIQREVLAGTIAVPKQLSPLKARPAEKGQQLYLEFAWQRSGPYLRELDRVKASIDWFVGAAKHRFR
jgi:hypothetical protein